MSKDIYNVALIELLPPNLRSNVDIIAASQAIDNEFKSLALHIKNCYIYGDIDNVNETILDLLAWEFHTDFYDTSLPEETKREIIKNSLLWHRTKGTPSTIEELITTIFGDGKVQEWFEYGGQPYHFKVITNNSSATTDQVKEFTRAVESVKNLRSKLEVVEVTATDEMNIYFGNAVHVYEITEIR